MYVQHFNTFHNKAVYIVCIDVYVRTVFLFNKNTLKSKKDINFSFSGQELHDSLKFKQTLANIFCLLSGPTQVCTLKMSWFSILAFVFYSSSAVQKDS